MKLQVFFLVMSVVLIVGGCNDNKLNDNFSIRSYPFDFSADVNEWSGDFADFSVKDSAKSDLKSTFSNRPANIAAYSSQKAIMLSGHNLGDNLFMFIKRKIDGLSPNKEYTVVFEIELGINGTALAPGDSLYVKVGAKTSEPKKTIQNGFYRVDIDKGQVNIGGNDVTKIGSIGSYISLDDYTLLKKSNFSSTKALVTVRANDNGEAWLIVGTDSAFKGLATVYYASVNAVLSASK